MYIFIYIYSEFYKIINFSVFNVPPQKKSNAEIKKKTFAYVCLLLGPHIEDMMGL